MIARTVSRKPLTRSDSEKSIVASRSSHCCERLEVPAENAIDVLRRKVCLHHLAQDGAMIVPAVAGRIAVRPIAAVQATRCAQRPQRAMPQRLVQIRA